MEIKAAAGEIASQIIPFFGKSKTIKQISKEVGEAADNELSNSLRFHILFFISQKNNI